jgi:hypothetical protein
MTISLNSVVYTFRGFTAQAVSTYLNTAVGIARGFKALTCKIDGNVAASNGTVKVRWKLKLPTLATDTTGGAKPGDMLYENFVDIVATVAASASAAERLDLALQLKDLTATPEFQASVKDLIVPSA